MAKSITAIETWDWREKLRKRKLGLERMISRRCERFHSLMGMNGLFEMFALRSSGDMSKE